jgi:hypothetical protein
LAAAPGEHPHQAVVAERLQLALPAPTDQEDQRAVGVGWPLLHHVRAQHRQCLGLVQVDHALEAGLGPGSPGVVVAVPHDNAAATVGDVLQVQAEDLTRAQAALEHQQHDGPVTQPLELHQQRFDLGIVQRTRDPLDGFDTDAAADRLLSAGPAHERPAPRSFPRCAACRR